MNARVLSRAVLLSGLALLAFGVFLGLRHGGDTTIGETELRARLDSVERRLAAQPPRLDITLAQIGARDYQTAITATADDDALMRFSVVDNEVTNRLQTGQPAVKPDIRALLRQAAPRSESLTDYSRLFQQARVVSEGSMIVGLLLSRRDPGGAGTLRLEVYRLALRDFLEVFDAGELLPSSISDFGIDIHPPGAITDRRTIWIEWKSDPSGGQQFVPLSLLHQFGMPDVPENAGITSHIYGSNWVQIATDVVLVPHRLFFRRDDGSEIEIDIRDVLRTPLVMSSPASGG